MTLAMVVFLCATQDFGDPAVASGLLSQNPVITPSALSIKWVYPMNRDLQPHPNSALVQSDTTVLREWNGDPDKETFGGGQRGRICRVFKGHGVFKTSPDVDRYASCHVVAQISDAVSGGQRYRLPTRISVSRHVVADQINKSLCRQPQCVFGRLRAIGVGLSSLGVGCNLLFDGFQSSPCK